MKKKKLPLRREFSAGGVVYKKPGWWLLGKHSGYKKWVLPKGLIEKGERGIEAAVREVEEETAVKARVIDEKPVKREKYWFVASYDEEKSQKSEKGVPVRRVKVYQEDKALKKSGSKFRVLKTVSFYLMEYVSGNTSNHDWEMEEVRWFKFDEAVKKLAFEGEKEALIKAGKMVK